MTGSMPGIAASTRDTWEFGGLPNAVEAPENSLAFEVTCACTSMPTTTCQSPVMPLSSLVGFSATLIRRLDPMQIGVDPRGLAARVVLHQHMRPVPIALGSPP